MAKILVACEESQAITKAFRKLGHEAFSCDLLPCSGGHPEWHYQQDVFEVIDNGIGIETEFLELIFKPFKRLHTQAAYPGSGLGLAAVMKMIESINGTITVRSTPDEGSVFVFSIPK